MIRVSLSHLTSIFFIVAFLNTDLLLGQTGPLKISTVRKNDKQEIVFYATNNTADDYHIVVRVTRMRNVMCDCQLPYEANVSTGRTKLLTLKIDGFTNEVYYQYDWSHYKGWANPRLNKKIKYVLPVGDTKKTKVLGLKNIKETYGDEAPPEDFYAVGFKMNSGDTVFAARRGKVERIKDGTEPEGENLSFARNKNSVVIRHKDKSLANYSIFKNNSFFVSPGDFVEAGDPLGIVGGENYVAGPHVRLTTYYLSFDKMKDAGKEYGWVYIKPTFATENNGDILPVHNAEYVSVHTTDLIRQEWTKREKKGKKKK
ncbi:MAG: hypothetical protein Roseis2KO_55060 [Roseivirga sp.]